ncbi:MAG TPA: IPT/TIG domain-containing protein [Bryobacteraceae bacterium]|nr:IPT/TIG domain-containing protein [Bryobacteraceae bacterium]
MGPFSRGAFRLLSLATLLISIIYSTKAQTPLPVSGKCAVTAVPTQVRAEGLTERMGDINLQCSGSNPGAVLTGNLSVSLPISITNRLDSVSSNLTHDAILSVDYGVGPVPTGIAGQISNTIIAFNGLSITVPSTGNFAIRISNIRAGVHISGVLQPLPITAQIIFGSPVSILVDNPQPVVAFAQTGLFDTLYDSGITCTGSPLPDSINVPSLFARGTAFFSTRLTEGFGGAFKPRAATEDNGTRFLISYTGFPSQTHLYIPDLVAGSDAATPTAGGDLGYQPQIGQYALNSHTLLLVRVIGADANGAGGSMAPLPPAASSGLLSGVTVTEVPLSGGSGYAVYEVFDASPTLLETVQFPTFVGLANVTSAAVAHETASFAPVSNVLTASATAPIQRFAPSLPSSDCTIVGDCGAAYFPRLTIPATSAIQLTAVSGGDQTGLAGYVPIQNAGGGILNWSATVNYTSGTGWLHLDNSSGQNNSSIIVTASGKGLSAGVYQANIVVDAGSAGSITIPVTLTVTAAPAPTPQVVVTKVINSATLDATPLVGGSLGTIIGTHLSGKSVSVTFDGSAATLLYSSDSQINLQVPDMGAKTSASMIVTADGLSSTPLTVPLAPAWPAVFGNGILNQDNTVNSTTAGAKAGSILQIFATGIPANATVSAQIAGRKDLVPLYAGPAPTVPGVQQVNVAVPADVTASNTQLVLCATTAGQQFCSAGSALVIQ